MPVSETTPPYTSRYTSSSEQPDAPQTRASLPRSAHGGCAGPSDRAEVARRSRPMAGAAATSPHAALAPRGTAALMSHYVAIMDEGEHAAREVFADPQKREQFGNFLRHVHRQLDVERALDICAQAVADSDAAHADDGDIEAATEAAYLRWYAQVRDTLGQARAPGALTNLARQIEALTYLKRLLGSQTVSLLAQGGEVDGCLELGYCGRLFRPLQELGLKLRGDKIAVHEMQSLSNLAEVGGLGASRFFATRPNDKFVPLDDYAPLTDHVATNSLDLVLCPIGLHHCPPSQLDAYIDSIAAVLRPGGSFVVREHDVGVPGVQAMATMAHAVFNAADKVALADENGEVRNFQTVQAWTRLLESRGFVREPGAEVQQGDPSANTLLRFTRTAAADANLDARVDAMERTMRMSCKDYMRPASQGHMTTLEWHLVDTAREQAEFGATQGPHAYPFLRQLGVLWRTFTGSTKDALRKGGVRSLPVEYVLMNLFMVASTSAELLGKALALAPLRILPRRWVKDSAGMQAMQKQQDDYARFIVHTPFFAFPYLKATGALWQAVRRGGIGQAPLNLYVALVGSIENLFKKAFSAPLNAFYAGGDYETIHFTVDDPQQRVTDGVLKTQGSLKGVRTQRYRPLTERLLQLTREGVQVTSVAGNRYMPVKLYVPQGAAVPTDLPGCSRLGDIPVVTGHDEARYVRVEVDIRQLRELVAAWDTQRVRVHYMHDF